MASVKLTKVKKVYDNNVVAVHDFDLDIKDKEFVVFVGPSGCGKSTTLRMIAGLEEISDGTVEIDGEVVNDLQPKDRHIAMVFQNYALYPHMTVYDNIAFSLRLQKMPEDEIYEKVTNAANILGITEYLLRKPRALSGGQRQRVAIGRAMVRDSKVFLMDEPLSNLDAKLRNQMRAEIILLRQKLDTTFIYVTHDQTEAMTLADRIVIMKDGYIMQVGTPEECFDMPAEDEHHEDPADPGGRQVLCYPLWLPHRGHRRKGEAPGGEEHRKRRGDPGRAARAHGSGRPR